MPKLAGPMLQGSQVCACVCVRICGILLTCHADALTGEIAKKVVEFFPEMDEATQKKVARYVGRLRTPTKSPGTTPKKKGGKRKKKGDEGAMEISLCVEREIESAWSWLW
jgi:hypothetical protein